MSALAKSQPVHSEIVPWLYWPLASSLRVGMPLYFSEIKVTGQEYLPQKGAVVLAPKHFSRWDPLLVSTLYREPLHYMTMLSQFKGVQGWVISRVGAFPVNVNRPQVSSLKYAVELLREGQKLVIFPEGGVVRDQLLRPLKTGLARLVLQVEADKPDLSIPIVPIALSYEPNSVFRAKVRMRICPPLYSSDYSAGDEKSTGSKLTAVLEQNLRAALAEISPS
ncbi:1-acyl-sn-glycerol-3-phosphate acyltransferase [Leptolyngbya sp. FACHB-261]|uniref:lysophospholipid acyltransferase family protein n=1 Tax=Leptolyngbya sp. FACHB-261 TaxID=2692806 RepID=UPI0016862B32|nr:lysophospholipid acyltransferase family protein [Leptolyngbya sp. FACHB-261]MBD2102254.1 1-acyl-sn-glycerol-3-phosphate acyltransferase [Leptolyngbya sp. FACHB-261]